jgi:nitrite reductase/ring-hydroxylating ferredoxin subunit
MNVPESRAVRVCEVSELAPGEIRRVPVSPPIALYNVDGEFYATSDQCSHQRASLSADGVLEGDVVQCRWHWAKFCVKNGSVVERPAKKPLACYDVRIEDDVIYVIVPASSTIVAQTA